jgi:hypothetical protein
MGLILDHQPLHVRFSNRPARVKRFQTIHDCSVDVLTGSRSRIDLVEHTGSTVQSPTQQRWTARNWGRWRPLHH